MLHNAYQFCRTHISRRLIFFVILFSVVLFFLALDFEKDYSMRRPFMGLLYRSQLGGVNTAELPGKSRDSDSNGLDTREIGKDFYRVDSNRAKGQPSENATAGNDDPARDTDAGSKFEHAHKVTTSKPRRERGPSKEFTLELVGDKENYTIPSAEGSKEIAAAGSRLNGTSFAKVKKGFLVYSEACQIPDVDPYHPTVRKLIATSPPLDCAKDYSPLTYADGNALRINESLLDYWKNREKMTFTNGSLVCCYHEIFRADDGRSDNAVGFSKNCTVFESGEEMKVEFVLVRCKIEGAPGILFKNYHSFVLDKPKTEQRCEEIEKNRTSDSAKFDKYNVVIIGADAMSRINMHRQLKKTFKYLTEAMGGIEMKGFNKVGDNTFPNLIPLLMGVDERELPQVCRNGSDPMDACTLIWDGFADEGYRTFYAEDTPHISTFNYLKPGFLTQPTDYYYRTMVHPLEDDLGRDKRLNCHLCVGAMAEAEAVLDYAQRFVSNFGSGKYFAMSWINSMSHDFLNSASAGDHFFANFFESLHNNSHLDNAFIILMGDHGLRWGEIRETHIGRLEERLPMLIIVPPKNFKDKYPDLLRNLRDNANRLVTPFDLYATIQNVLRFRGSAATVVPESVADEAHLQAIRAAVVKRSKSLFGPIRVNRSCQDAAIDEAWCTCHQSEPVDVKDKEVIHVSEFIVEKLNAVVGGHPECSKLHLRQVLKASLRTPKKNLHAERRPTSNILDYTVEIETVPGGAKFEGTVRFVPYKHEHTLLGDVSRLNLYGTQSSCVSDAVLRKYCYCVSPKR